MMTRIMREMAAVPRKACMRFLRLSERYAAASAIVKSAPIAADSVGVAQPADIEATTTTKIDQGQDVLHEWTQLLPAVVFDEGARRREPRVELEARHDVDDERKAEER